MLWFDHRDLRPHPNDEWYTWGRDRVGEVRDLEYSPERVIGTVESFVVRLTCRDGRLAGDCSCGWEQLRNFCEHCVAVGLAALAREPAEESLAAEPLAEEPADVPAYLGNADRATLVDLLTGLADTDPAVHQLLSLRAAGGAAPNADDLQELVDTLVRARNVEIDDIPTLTRSVDQILHTLRVVAIDHPQLVRPLYQQALRSLATSCAPDDYRVASVVNAAMSRVAEALVKVCRAAPPDPAELAQWLVDLQLDAAAGDLAVTDFADALGDTGLARYQALLEQQLVEDADPGDYEAAARADDRREKIFELRETFLAKITGDVDDLITLYTQDTSTNYRRHVKIGKDLRAAGRLDDAIRWLIFSRSEATRRQLGLTEPFGLTDLLADIYTQTGRHQEAARARWAAFEQNPTDTTYFALLRAAEPLDAVDYAKNRAMTFLHTRATARAKHADPLVTILTAIGDVDQAWAAAHEFRCSDNVQFLVARRRASKHPEDAIPFYEREVEAKIDRKQQGAYSSAARLLTVLKYLHHRAGTDFDTYLAHVKARHRRKSAFMEALAKTGL
ncbi:DUF6880 family protein [Amycolatopsis sp. NPDC059657]|uniref:DUF6880 family protein n=1 Tax=Amycolatopsis sp. NPDC059657 TaxID=3346899 RepID=UPI00366FF164